MRKRLLLAARCGGDEIWDLLFTAVAALRPEHHRPIPRDRPGFSLGHSPSVSATSQTAVSHLLPSIAVPV